MDEEYNLKDKSKKQKNFSAEVSKDSDSGTITQDLNAAIKSSIKSTSEIFGDLVDTIEANITDQVTKDNATKIVKDLNTEIFDTISKLKQTTIEEFPIHKHFEEE